jgi:formylglycine-generating enzyme required for sulfatase activity
MVFSQSKVNGAPYGGEHLHGQIWEWPKDTFLQRRLRQVKWLPNDNTSFN